MSPMKKIIERSDFSLKILNQEKIPELNSNVKNLNQNTNQENACTLDNVEKHCTAKWLTFFDTDSSAQLSLLKEQDQSLLDLLKGSTDRTQLTNPESSEANEACQGDEQNGTEISKLQSLENVPDGSFTQRSNDELHYSFPNTYALIQTGGKRGVKVTSELSSHNTIESKENMRGYDINTFPPSSNQEEFSFHQNSENIPSTEFKNHEIKEKTPTTKFKRKSRKVCFNTTGTQTGDFIIPTNIPVDPRIRFKHRNGIQFLGLKMLSEYISSTDEEQVVHHAEYIINEISTPSEETLLNDNEQSVKVNAERTFTDKSFSSCSSHRNKNRLNDSYENLLLNSEANLEVSKRNIELPSVCPAISVGDSETELEELETSPEMFSETHHTEKSSSKENLTRHFDSHENFSETSTCNLVRIDRNKGLQSQCPENVLSDPEIKKEILSDSDAEVGCRTKNGHHRNIVKDSKSEDTHYSLSFDKPHLKIIDKWLTQTKGLTEIVTLRESDDETSYFLDHRTQVTDAPSCSKFEEASTPKSPSTENTEYHVYQSQSSMHSRNPRKAVKFKRKKSKRKSSLNSLHASDISKGNSRKLIFSPKQKISRKGKKSEKIPMKKSRNLYKTNKHHFNKHRSVQNVKNVDSVIKSKNVHVRKKKPIKLSSKNINQISNKKISPRKRDTESKVIASIRKKYLSAMQKTTSTFKSSNLKKAKKSCESKKNEEGLKQIKNPMEQRQRKLNNNVKFAPMKLTADLDLSRYADEKLKSIRESLHEKNENFSKKYPDLNFKSRKRKQVIMENGSESSPPKRLKRNLKLSEKILKKYFSIQRRNNLCRAQKSKNTKYQVEKNLNLKKNNESSSLLSKKTTSVKDQVTNGNDVGDVMHQQALVVQKNFESVRSSSESLSNQSNFEATTEKTSKSATIDTASITTLNCRVLRSRTIYFDSLEPPKRREKKSKQPSGFECINTASGVSERHEVVSKQSSSFEHCYYKSLATKTRKVMPKRPSLVEHSRRKKSTSFTTKRRKTFSGKKANAKKKCSNIQKNYQHYDTNSEPQVSQLVIILPSSEENENFVTGNLNDSSDSTAREEHFESNQPIHVQLVQNFILPVNSTEAKSSESSSTNSRQPIRNLCLRKVKKNNNRKGKYPTCYEVIPSSKDKVEECCSESTATESNIRHDSLRSSSFEELCNEIIEEVCLNETQHPHYYDALVETTFQNSTQENQHVLSDMEDENKDKSKTKVKEVFIASDHTTLDYLQLPESTSIEENTSICNTATEFNEETDGFVENGGTSKQASSTEHTEISLETVVQDYVEDLHLGNRTTENSKTEVATKENYLANNSFETVDLSFKMNSNNCKNTKVQDIETELNKAGCDMENSIAAHCVSSLKNLVISDNVSKDATCEICIDSNSLETIATKVKGRTLHNVAESSYATLDHLQLIDSAPMVEIKSTSKSAPEFNEKIGIVKINVATKQVYSKPCNKISLETVLPDSVEDLNLDDYTTENNEKAKVTAKEKNIASINFETMGENYPRNCKNFKIICIGDTATKCNETGCDLENTTGANYTERNIVVSDTGFQDSVYEVFLDNSAKENSETSKNTPKEESENFGTAEYINSQNFKDNECTNTENAREENHEAECAIENAIDLELAKENIESSEQSSETNPNSFSLDKSAFICNKKSRNLKFQDPEVGNYTDYLLVCNPTVIADEGEDIYDVENSCRINSQNFKDNECTSTAEEAIDLYEEEVYATKNATDLELTNGNIINSEQISVIIPNSFSSENRFFSCDKETRNLKHRNPEVGNFTDYARECNPSRVICEVEDIYDFENSCRINSQNFKDNGYINTEEEAIGLYEEEVYATENAKDLELTKGNIINSEQVSVMIPNNFSPANRVFSCNKASRNFNHRDPEVGNFTDYVPEYNPSVATDENKDIYDAKNLCSSNSQNFTDEECTNTEDEAIEFSEVNSATKNAIDLELTKGNIINSKQISASVPNSFSSENRLFSCNKESRNFKHQDPEVENFTDYALECNPSLPTYEDEDTYDAENSRSSNVLEDRPKTSSNSTEGISFRNSVDSMEQIEISTDDDVIEEKDCKRSVVLCYNEVQHNIKQIHTEANPILMNKGNSESTNLQLTNEKTRKISKLAEKTFCLNKKAKSRKKLTESNLQKPKQFLLEERYDGEAETDNEQKSFAHTSIQYFNSDVHNFRTRDKGINIFNTSVQQLKKKHFQQVQMHISPSSVTNFLKHRKEIRIPSLQRDYHPCSNETYSTEKFQSSFRKTKTSVSEFKISSFKRETLAPEPKTSSAKKGKSLANIKKSPFEQQTCTLDSGNVPRKRSVQETDNTLPAGEASSFRKKIPSGLLRLKIHNDQLTLYEKKSNHAKKTQIKDKSKKSKGNFCRQLKEKIPGNLLGTNTQVSPSKDLNKKVINKNDSLNLIRKIPRIHIKNEIIILESENSHQEAQTSISESRENLQKNTSKYTSDKDAQVLDNNDSGISKINLNKCGGISSNPSSLKDKNINETTKSTFATKTESFKGKNHEPSNKTAFSANFKKGNDINFTNKRRDAYKFAQKQCRQKRGNYLHRGQ